MADFINYGDLQLEQLALLNNLANNVQNYVNTQPWSNKRKEKFMSAYSDIMNNGVLGVSNSTGQWVLNTRNAIDLNSKDRKDREMYQEAAYFIQQQMAGLSSKVASEKEQEEKKKEELPTFDNEYFTNGFTTKLSNMWYGGNKDIRISSDWNTLDERGENGLRGTSVRRERLAKTLESYLKDFDETKVNFENSPFKDATDFRNRLNTAISKLRSGEDVTDALNAIGLRSSDWFYDGSGDLYDIDKDGNPITYGQYAESKIKLEQQKALEEALLRLLKANAMRGVLSLVGGIHAVEARNTPEAYQEYLTTYGTGQAGFNAVNNRVSELINKGYAGQLTGADKKELGNLLYYIRSNNPNYKGLGDGTHTNITDQEWADLRLHTDKLSSVNRGNFIRLPWKTQGGRYTYVDNKGNLYFLKPNKGLKFSAPAIRGKGYYDYKNNFLNNTKAGIDKLLQNFLKQLGMTDADIAELSGIGLDIASIIDPEPLTAGILGLSAAGARNYARTRDPKDWSLGDYATQGFDYLTGAFGAIPGLGDAALAGKTIGNIAKWGKRIMTIPAIWDMASHTPGATTAIKKAINGEDLTVEDYRNIGSFIRGLTATRNITVLNRAQRRAFEKSGYDLSNLNSFVKKAGLWDTSVPKTLSTVKVNVKGKEVQIPLKSKLELDAKLKKAGNNQTAKDKAIREAPEVKEYIQKNNLKEEDVTAITSSSLRNAKLFGERIGILPKSFRTTSSNYGESNISSPTNPNRLEEYLNSDRGWWDRLKYGSNTTIRNFAPKSNENRFSGNSNPLNSTTRSESQPKQLNFTPTKLDDIKTINKFWDNYKLNKGQNVSNDLIFNIDGKSGVVDLGGSDRILYFKNSDGTFSATWTINNKSYSKNFKDIKELKQRMAKLASDISTTRSNKRMDHKKVAQMLRSMNSFKLININKQGGKITDTQIDNFLKQYK